MKVRDGGMPEEAYWESLFDVPLILDRLGVDPSIGDAVELGCGYGTFSLAIARRIAGTLRTFDIEPGMVDRTRTRAREAGLANLRCAHRDLLRQGYGVDHGSQDAVFLFNILHVEEPVALLSGAARLLAPGGASAGDPLEARSIDASRIRAGDPASSR